MSRFTEEQLAAINAEGRTIVSASAGSGKTTVMIEKILNLLKKGVSVKKILAVTFTKKAAAQMKEKLRKGLVKAINDPSVSEADKSSLKTQLAEVGGADISTIHAFCSGLIRSHFFLAGVDGNFSIIAENDADGATLKARALDEVFEEAYENGEERFEKLLSVYWRKKSDNKLRALIADTHSALRSKADYREFLSNERATEEKFDGIVLDLYERLTKKCEYYVSLAERERAYFEEIGKARSLANAEEVLAALDSLLSAGDYFSACALPAPRFSDKERKKKDDSEETTAHINALAGIKDKVKGIYASLTDVGTRGEELKNYLAAGEIAACLASYILRFDDKYAEAKRERSLLDYNDLEHIALELLKNPSVKEEMRAKYRYVFVDEYQDVNPVQEKILSAVGGENVFLVGDVKQSIYGFRGSKSAFFLEKQREFEGKAGSSSLYLTRNFRSADEVLDAVNAQFSLAMTKDNSEIDYRSGSVMEKGGRYATNKGRVRIRTIPKEKAEKSVAIRGVYSVEANLRKEREKSDAYAREIAQIIRSERNAKYFDPDAGENGEFKRVDYGDIAILSRKKSGRIERVVAALSEEGIPVSSVAAINICDYPEVKTLTDILSLVDNAEQDIPLCSALLSAMGELTADDLTAIRLAYPDEKFFRECCKRYAAEKEDERAHRLRRFYRYLDELRTLSAVTDAGELLSKILVDTNMEARLLSRDNGASCLKRIQRLISETVTPEPLCVHDFLDRLRALDYRVEYSENGGENAVRVLTMHASKGLEYPVVILDDLNARFHGADRDEVLVHEKYGLAPKAYDRAEMTVGETLLRRLQTEIGEEESVKDELNLFYVALTRAKYGLYMLFTADAGLPDVKYAKSFADFVDRRVWSGYEESASDFSPPFVVRDAIVQNPDEELVDGIVSAFSAVYGYAGAENLPVKSSATAVMHGFDEKRERYAAANPFPDETDEPTETGEKAEEKKLAGIAYHAFLERFDFTACTDENAIEKELARVNALLKGTLDEQTYALLDEERERAIVENPVFRSLENYELHRERQFLVSLPAEEVFLETVGTIAGKEEILFQGAIDLLAVGKDEVRLVDYKYSSAYRKEDRDALKKRYAPQLLLYKKATAKILKLPEEKISCRIVNIRYGYEIEL